MTWRVPDKKIYKCLDSIHSVFYSNTCHLVTWQKLLGRLNDVSQICDFMKLFKPTLNDCLSGIASNAQDDTTVLISKEAKADLLVWYGFLTNELKWLPLGSAYSEPPIRCLEFMSDAAGLADSSSLATGPGAGSVGFCENGTIIFASQILWPKYFITEATDEKGVRFGDKSTTLEVIGVLIPFLLCPELLRNQHILVKVDSFGAIFSLINKHAKGDKCASVFVRALFLIASYLECRVHVQHLPRMSDWGAEVTDRLSRLSSTTRQDRKLVQAFDNRPLPVCLLRWFNNPFVDWSLAASLLQHVKTIV